ncbi:MAG: molybdopterin molybdotransferase MoeA [Clostridiales Family XIII bacterium]|jgi:molybdopterin molybdotransferase/putative molybdopterin biosynthesis protein|nr:molybdopterin molybdotransferase MoeA [Clostridiales Family XIII bacterium]
MLDLSKNERMPTRREALDAILSKWKPAPQSETIPVDEALGRVAARDHVSRHDLPVVRASSMDGVGVDSSLFAKGVPDASAWRAGVEYARADTGDDFDDRFDAVIPIEAVRFPPGGGISFEADLCVTPGMNVRPAGSSVRKGERLVAAGTRLRPFDLSVLVLGGLREAEVIKKPVVAFIPTGSELVPQGSAPARGQTVDSNSALARHMLAEMGAAPLCLPIVRDDPEALRAAIRRARAEADIVLLCGGSSKGGEDFNAEIVAEMGESLFHWIASAPGRPTAAAMLDGAPLINMPGPPPAAYFVMDWCVRALVTRFLGTPETARKTVRALLPDGLDATPGMEILRKLELQKTGDAYEARAMELKAVSVVRALTAPAQLVTDAGPRGREPGERVEIELLR